MIYLEDKIMPPPFSGRVGDTYGRLTITSIGEVINKNRTVICDCSCGNKNILYYFHKLKCGHTQSCGCFHKERISETHFKHGCSATYKARNGKSSPEYESYQKMIARCYNENTKYYNDYGGRGIKVCDRWLDKEKGFINFLEDMGECPTEKTESGKTRKYTLDRFPDINGNYELSNCRWTDKNNQCINRRKLRNNTSGYIGVSWVISYKKWRAEIRINYQNIYLGCFDIKEDAARAVNEAWRKYRSEYKIPNPSVETIL